MDLELTIGELLQAEQDAVTVEAAERHGLQDQHIQGALYKIDLFFHSSTV